MIYIIALLLFVIAALEALRIKAARTHSTVLTVLHAELDDFSSHLEKIEGKIDGGAVPK